MTPSDSSSGIRDNQLHGSVKDYLASAICPGSSLSFVSAYFTIQAYVALAEQLESILAYNTTYFGSYTHTASNEGIDYIVLNKGFYYLKNYLFGDPVAVSNLEIMDSEKTLEKIYENSRISIYENTG